MDEEVFQKIWGVLSTADGVRRDGAARSGTVEARDSIGDLHLLLFGDFKKLPPATGKAPFIVLPRVQFQFRVLRQNRPSFSIFPTSAPPLDINPKPACSARPGADPGDRELPSRLDRHLVLRVYGACARIHR